MKSKLKFLINNNLRPFPSWNEIQIKIFNHFINSHSNLCIAQMPAHQGKSILINTLACGYALCIQNAAIGIISISTRTSFDAFKRVTAILTKVGHQKEDLIFNTAYHDSLISRKLEGKEFLVDSITSRFTGSTISFYQANRLDELSLTKLQFLFIDDYFEMEILMFYIFIVPLLLIDGIRVLMLGTPNEESEQWKDLLDVEFLAKL